MAFDLYDLWLYLCLVHNLLESVREVEVADAQGTNLVVAIGILQDPPGVHVVASQMVQVQTIEVVYQQSVEPLVDSSKGVSVVAGPKFARKPNLLARNTAVDDSLSHASLVVVAMGRVQVVIPTDSAATTNCLTVSFKRSRPDSLESDSSACAYVPSPSCGSYTWFERSSRGTAAVETISVACALLSDTTGTLFVDCVGRAGPQGSRNPKPHGTDHSAAQKLPESNRFPHSPPLWALRTLAFVRMSQPMLWPSPRFPCYPLALGP